MPGISDKCKECISEICDVVEHSSCPTFGFGSALIVSITVSTIVGAIAAFVVCYMFKRNELAKTKTVPQEGEDGETTGQKSITRTRNQQKLEQKSFGANNDMDEVPSSRFKLRTIKFEPQPDVPGPHVPGPQTLKAIKSGATTTTGDIAFIAPRDEEEEEGRGTSRGPPRPVPKSPSFQVAGRDKLVIDQFQQRKKDIPERAKDRDNLKRKLSPRNLMRK